MRAVEQPVAVDVLRRLLEEEHVVRLGTREALEGGDAGAEIPAEPGDRQRNLVLVGGDPLDVVPEATELRERPSQTHSHVEDAGRRRRQPGNNEVRRPLLRRQDRLTRVLEEAVVQVARFPFLLHDYVYEDVQWIREITNQRQRCLPGSRGLAQSSPGSVDRIRAHRQETARAERHMNARERPQKRLRTPV